MPKQPLVFFLVVFAGLTLIDAGSTWWCVHRLGFGETNPWTETESLWTLLRPELIAWIIGAASVSLGSWMTFRSGTWSGEESFAEFRAKVLHPWKLAGTMLLVVPCVFAVGRLMPVLNNLAFILFGESGFRQLVAKLGRALGTSYLHAYAFSYVILFAALLYPVCFLIYRRTVAWRTAHSAENQEAANH